MDYLLDINSNEIEFLEFLSLVYQSINYKFKFINSFFNQNKIILDKNIVSIYFSNGKQYEFDLLQDCKKYNKEKDE